MKYVARNEVLDSEVKTWFGKFLKDNDQQIGFTVVGPRLVLTADKTLLYIRHDNRIPWKPGKPSEPFVLVHGLCPECRKVVRNGTQCRNWDAVRHERAGTWHDYTHVCGASEDVAGLLGWLELYDGYGIRVFEMFFGMTPGQMKDGYALTRLGPVQLQGGGE